MQMQNVSNLLKYLICPTLFFVFQYYLFSFAVVFYYCVENSDHRLLIVLIYFVRTF